MATLAFNPRDRLHNVHGRLFQAAMWRRYAMDWDLPSTFFGATELQPLARRWVEHVLRKSRAECMRRARVNARLARRLNRRSADPLDIGAAT